MKRGNTLLAILAVTAALIATPRALSMDSYNYNELICAIDHGDTVVAREIFHNNPHLLSPELINQYLCRAICQAATISYGSAAVSQQERAELEKTKNGCLEIATGLIVYGADIALVEEQYPEMVRIARQMALTEITKQADSDLREAIKNADYHLVKDIIEQHPELMQDESRAKELLRGARAVALSIAEALKSLQPLPKKTNELLDAYFNSLNIITLFEGTQLHRRGSLYELKEDISLASDEPFSLSPLTSQQASRQATPARPLPLVVGSQYEADHALPLISEPVREAHLAPQLVIVQPEQNTSSSCSCASCVIL